MRSVILTSCVVVLAALAAGDSSIVLEAHRLVQYDAVAFGRPASENTKHGSAKAALRGTLASGLGAALTTATPLVIDAVELPDDIGALLQRATGGLVVVLPQSPSAQVATKLTALEEAGATGQTAGAVYVVPHSSNVTALRALVASASAVQLVASPAPLAARTVATASKVTVLTADAVATSGKAPIIAVAAGFDTLGAFPSAPQVGAAADAAVVVELAHMFGGQHAAAEGKGLLFVLSSGDRHSYHGLKQWVQATETVALADRVQLMVCLEGAVGSELSLHAARDIAKDAAASLVLKTLSATASVKKVDPASNELRWAHEVFVHKGVPAVTLSATASAKKQLLRTSIASKPVSADDIVAAADRVAAALTALTGLQPKTSARRERIEKFLAAVDVTPRPTYAMPAVIVSEIQRSLTAAVSVKASGKSNIRVRRADFDFAPPEAIFYGPDAVIITAHAAQPTAFELGITAVIVVGLIGAAVGVLGQEEATKMFRRSLASKRK